MATLPWKGPILRVRRMKRTRESTSRDDTSSASEWLSDDEFEGDEEQLDLETLPVDIGKPSTALTARQRIEIYRERKALEEVIDDDFLGEFDLEFG